MNPGRLCLAQLTAEDRVDCPENVALDLLVLGETPLYLQRDAVQHRFELGNQLCGACGVIGKFYGMASKFGKQPDVPGGYHIGAMNAFVAGLHLETQQRVYDFGGIFFP